MTFLSGLSEIASRYDTFLVDLWGVMHNGKAAFSQAVEAIRKIAHQGGSVVFVSNSPRRAMLSRARLKSFGILPSDYTDIYTSGEDCRGRLEKRDNPWYQKLGQRFFLIGKEGNLPLISDLSFTQVERSLEADFLLNIDVSDWESTLTEYEEMLGEAAAAGRPMICVNPDKVVQYEGRLALCAGALAQRYEDLGGEVYYHGKPCPDFYQRLFQRIKVSPTKDRILAIGDSMTTDIPGAQQAGVDSVLIASGIHAEAIGSDTARGVTELSEKYNLQPTYVLSKLLWTDR